MKKGLGRIPKSLSWIDTLEEAPVVETKNEVHEPKIKQKKNTNKEIRHQPAVMQAEVPEVTEETPAQITMSNKGLPAGWTRATFIVDQDLNEKIKALAYWERLTVKEVMHEALTQYMQGRNVKPIPKKKAV